jgi:hypothetical protein
MAFSGRRTVSLQLYSLGGRPGGPFFRNLPIFPPKLFQLLAWIKSTFQLNAQQKATFQLPAQVEEPFELEV